MVFVLKETEPEAWISNGGDFAAYLKPPGVDEVVDKVGTFCSRSIFLQQEYRYCLRARRDFATLLVPPGMDEAIDKVGALCSRRIVTFHRLAVILPPSLSRLA